MLFMRERGTEGGKSVKNIDELVHLFLQLFDNMKSKNWCRANTSDLVRLVSICKSYITIFNGNSLEIEKAALA